MIKSVWTSNGFQIQWVVTRCTLTVKASRAIASVRLMCAIMEPPTSPSKATWVRHIGFTQRIATCLEEFVLRFADRFILVTEELCWPTSDSSRRFLGLLRVSLIFEVSILSSLVTVVSTTGEVNADCSGEEYVGYDDAVVIGIKWLWRGEGKIRGSL